MITASCVFWFTYYFQSILSLVIPSYLFSLSSLLTMATFSASSVTFASSLKPSLRNNVISERTSNPEMVAMGWRKNNFPPLKTNRFRVCSAAKPETVQKVCEIVRKQLALPAETELTSESKFSALGADSLDTVEIVMSLEEEFGISVEEESSQNITTVQEAADLIEKLVEKKSD